MTEMILCKNCSHELDRFKHQIVGVIWFGKFIGVSKTIYLHWIKNDKWSALKCHCGCKNPEPEKAGEKKV